MRKQEINNEIAKKSHINIAITETIIETFMSTIKEQLLNKKAIHLRGFGNFYLKKKGAKKARIIRKNIQIIIPEHYAPVFKPSKRFRDMVKKNIK